MKQIWILGLMGMTCLNGPVAEAMAEPDVRQAQSWETYAADKKQLKSQLEAARKEKNDARILEALRALGEIALKEDENSRAAAYYQKVRKFQERTMGKHHPSVADTLDRLAGIYMLPHVVEPQACYGSPFATQTSFDAMGNLHEVYAEKWSPTCVTERIGPRYRSAEKSLTRALMIRRKQWGEDSMELVPYLRAIAHVETRLGRRSQARRASQEASRIVKASIAADRALQR